MAEDNHQWFAFVGAYDSGADAEADFMTIKDAKAIGLIGKYQSALFEKEADGKVKVLNTDSTTRATGAKWGAAVGAVMGVIFPPSLLAGLFWGTSIGALAGNIGKGWGAGDVKALGDALEPGESGIVLVAQATPEVAAKRILKMAATVEKKQIDESVKELESQIDEMAAESD
jgi:uncharacterized membrane protein